MDRLAQKNVEIKEKFSFISSVTVEEHTSKTVGIDYVDITHSINGRILAKNIDIRSSTRKMRYGQLSAPTTAIYNISIADMLDDVNRYMQVTNIGFPWAVNVKKRTSRELIPKDYGKCRFLYWFYCYCIDSDGSCQPTLGLCIADKERAGTNARGSKTPITPCMTVPTPKTVYAILNWKSMRRYLVRILSKDLAGHVSHNNDWHRCE